MKQQNLDQLNGLGEQLLRRRPSSGVSDGKVEILGFFFGFPNCDLKEYGNFIPIFSSFVFPLFVVSVIINYSLSIIHLRELVALFYVSAGCLFLTVPLTLSIRWSMKSIIVGSL